MAPPRPRWRFLENPLFHAALLAATFVTTTLAGGAAFSTGGGPLLGGRFADGLAFSVPLLVILGIHELGHYAMCRRYGIAATLPYFIPSPFLNLIGTFGAVIRIKEPIRRKKQLLDVGAAGPLAGFFTAIPFLLYGVARPKPSATPLTEGTVLFDYPLLVRWAQRWVHVGPYTSATVHEHPTFMAAWFGLLVTCLNLLPIGQLDGGHVLRAAVGRRQPIASGIALALCIVAGVTHSAVWLVLPVAIVVVAGLAHPPVEDDDQPLDFARMLVALLCVAVFLVCFSLTPIRIV
ncbi:MAG TPA: site-2 protease family protein [Thermoanaerobaculia bacterium]|nr:site-2 protease family protein [Thermoanaerobaculia bacterium]